MSAVISRTRQFYRKAVLAFAVLWCLFTIVIAIYQVNVAISFLFGTMAAFLPFCLSVYWVFFRQKSNGVTVFYQAEGVKWCSTILLITMTFLFITDLHYVAFFAGYFLALLGNIILPFLMKRSAN